MALSSAQQPGGVPGPGKPRQYREVSCGRAKWWVACGAQTSPFTRAGPLEPTYQSPWLGQFLSAIPQLQALGTTSHLSLPIRAGGQV